MSTLTIPVTFQPNTTAKSGDVNSDFTAISNWANGNVGSSNINATEGIKPSLLVWANTADGTIAQAHPLTVAPSATGVSALVLTSMASASASTLTINMGSSQSVAGLLINGAASITGNLLEIDLTSGGTKTFTVNSVGGVAVGVPLSALGFGALSVASTTSAGSITLGGSGSSGEWDYGVTASAQHTWSAAGVARMSLSSAGTLSAVQVVVPAAGVGLGVGAGSLQVGKTNNATQALDFGNAIGAGAYTTIGSMGDTTQTIVGSQFEIKATGSTSQLTVDGAGNLGIAGALHQSSKRSAKKNIQDLTFDPLDVICETNWQQYQLNEDPDDKQPHVGFIADDSSEWLGGATKEYLIPSDLAGITAAGLKLLTLKLRAAGIAV